MTFQLEFRPETGQVGRQASAPWLLLLMLCLVAAFSGPKAARADSQAGREFWFAWPETADASANDPSYDLDAQVVILSVSGPVSVQVTGPGLATSVMASPGSPAFVRLSRASIMMDVPAKGLVMDMT